MPNKCTVHYVFFISFILVPCSLMRYEKSDTGFLLFFIHTLFSPVDLIGPALSPLPAIAMLHLIRKC